MKFILSLLSYFVLFNFYTDSSSTTEKNYFLSCGTNERFSQCVPFYSYCERHCPYYSPYLGFFPDCLRNTTQKFCRPGCVCATGYVRDFRTGNCIDFQYCPQVGDTHAVYSACGAACQPTCSCLTPLVANSTCPCTAGCVPGYVCTTGYVKNSAGYCVLPSACP